MVNMGEKINSYRVVVGKFEGKKPLVRLRGSWENNIKVDVKRNRMGKCRLE
jgi:hypothetical protein